MTRSGPAAGTSRDAGFALAEMLVAMALLAVLGALLLGFSLGSSRVADDVRRSANVTEEARLAVERMSRELRQARSLSGAVVVDGAVTSITLHVDFDGDGVIAGNDQVDPEVLTYRWLVDQDSLTLTANHAVARPVLAGGVVRADIRLRSSQWIHDGDGDGTTTWQELDDSSVGNGNDVPDGDELALIDLVSVELEVRDGEVSRTFTMQADMRNRTPGGSS